MTIHVLKRREGDIQAITTDDDVAAEWLGHVNKDWQLSGNIRPSYIVESWEPSNTLEEALAAKEMRAATIEAKRYMDQFQQLSPAARAIVRQHDVD